MELHCIRSQSQRATSQGREHDPNGPSGEEQHERDTNTGDECWQLQNRS